MTDDTRKSRHGATTTPPPPRMTIDTTQVTTEHAEETIRPLLMDGDRLVEIDLKPQGAVPDKYIDALFGKLMRSAMATGGRRLAIKWMERLRIEENAEERAHRAMARTINLQLRFGMLSPPLAEQAGCRTDLLKHEQQDADCIARLAVRGIAIPPTACTPEGLNPGLGGQS